MSGREIRRAAIGRGVIGRIVDVRDGELGALLWSFLYFFLLLTAYTAIRPLRDEMGIAGGVRHLPWLFTATFAVTLIVVPAWSALTARVPRRILLPVVYHFFALNLVAFFFVLRGEGSKELAARAFFVWTSVFNLTAVAVFWIAMADIFRHEQATRLFGFVAAGGSAGAVLGPLLTTTLVGALPPASLLLVSAAILEAVVVCVGRLNAHGRSAARDADRDTADTASEPAGDDRPVGGGALAGIKLMFASGYLRAIGGYTFFVTLLGTSGYLIQAGLMASSGLTPAERTALFARIDLTTNVLTVCLQAFLTGKILARIGVGGALAALPVLASLSFVAQGIAPTVAMSSAMQVLRRAVGYGVSNPAVQVLFTVVSREQKYKAKAFIDTTVYRGGDVVGSWAMTALAAAGVGVAGSALCALPLGVLWFAVARVVGRRHRSLTRSGAAASA